MSNHGSTDPVSNPGIQYESRDLGSRGIVMFLVVLAISGIAIELLVWGMLRVYTRMTINENVPSTGVSQTYTQQSQIQGGNPTLRFPKPVLQVDDEADMNKFKIENEQILNSYSWVDRNAGIVRIPIQQAIDEVAQKGLPVRPEPAIETKAQFGDGNGTIQGEGGGVGALANH